MKKILFILLAVLMIPVTGICKNQAGLTINYATPAGQFVQGANAWTYEQDTASLGVFTILELDEGIYLKLVDRLIFGSSEVGDVIGLTGNTVKTSLSINDHIVFTYQYNQYWVNKDLSPIYNLCTSPSHKFTLEVNIPIVSF